MMNTNTIASPSAPQSTNSADTTIRDCAQRTIDQLPTTSDRALVKVLLIDDQPIVAESIRRLLASEPDIQLSYCHAPQQAIPQALEFKPTVILQDLVMPDVDGLMMVKFFRANPATHAVPIIVLSSQDESVIKAEAFATGANDYLVKVPDPIELIARLRYHSTAYANLIKRQAAEQSLAEANQRLEARVLQRTSELTEALDTLKRTQSQLVHDEKMTSLGQLMAGIAHEINNPVSFITGNVSPALDYAESLLKLVALYQREYPQPSEGIAAAIEELDIDFVREDFVQLLNSLKTGADRIRDLVLSLKSFSHMDRQGMQTADIHQGIENTLLILKSKLKAAQVKVNRQYGDCPAVKCLPGQLNQVFMNILVNAIDAIEEKASRAATASDYQPEICIQTHTVDDRWFVISIRDNGPGVPDQVKEQLFDPFFTTKPIGKGTGLGLSISHQIVVERHQGQLEVSSNPQQGTTFLIQIPLRQAP
ncbi:MAG: hybrid sensor histidine kinase/response regulator [Spirulinaceae cyanobacterium]